MKVKYYIEKILLFDILIALFIELLKCYISFAEIINFIPDILNLFIIFIVGLSIIKSNKGRVRVDLDIGNVIFMFFIIWVIITCFFPIGTIIDKYRRIRYIIFGFIAYHFAANDVEESFWNKLVKLLFYVQIIHTVLVFYQFFIMKTRADMTNGIFGYLEYNNAAHGLFCIITTIISIEGYLRKKISAGWSFAIISMSCITNAIAEIKAYYVLLAMGIIGAAILNILFDRHNTRLIKLVGFIFCNFIIAYVIIALTIPQNLYAFTSLSNWAQYESYETSRADGLGRLTQISWIYKIEFQNNTIAAILGKGAGYNNSIVVYELGKLFLNFGFIGLVLFLLFIFFGVIRMFLICKKSLKATVSCIMFILIPPMIVVWNTTLNRMSMILFVILAMGSFDIHKRTKGDQVK